MDAKFAVSVMCMDFLNLRTQIEKLNSLADYYHFDIMDGHFSPNLMLPPSFVTSLAAAMKLPIDVHLMVERPGQYIEALAKAGVSIISLHAETINAYAFRIINHVKALGCKVGIALNPATPLTYIKHYMHLIDMLTIMTVDIGYSGNPFIEEMLKKIKMAYQMRRVNDYHYLIQVDGACNESTFGKLTRAGAEVFVMGNTGLFKHDPDIEKAYSIMLDYYRREAG